MANVNVIPLAKAAALPPQTGRHLAEREVAWGRLVKAGLAWQPDPNRQADANPVLILSSVCEWTAEHLKDAALHLLRVEAALREMGWTLGAIVSPWIQFAGCRPVWISQTALRPRGSADWAGRRAFLDEFLNPLLQWCGRRTPEPPWLGLLRRAAARWTGRAGRDDLAELMESVENLKPRPQWSPWRSRLQALEPPGLAAIQAQEEASRRGARLVYEWRGPQPASEPLRPFPGAAWIRFHSNGDDAAADYLEQRAVHGRVLPLWNRSGDPVAACPRRSEADLLIAAGRGNVPSGAASLDGFARIIRRMARAVLVEYVPEPGGVTWETFLHTMRGACRILHVTETGAGRRLCLLERAGSAVW